MVASDAQNIIIFFEMLISCPLKDQHIFIEENQGEVVGVASMVGATVDKVVLTLEQTFQSYNNQDFG